VVKFRFTNSKLREPFFAKNRKIPNLKIQEVPRPLPSPPFIPLPTPMLVDVQFTFNCRVFKNIYFTTVAQTTKVPANPSPMLELAPACRLGFKPNIVSVTRVTLLFIYSEGIKEHLINMDRQDFETASKVKCLRPRRTQNWVSTRRSFVNTATFCQ